MKLTDCISNLDFDIFEKIKEKEVSSFDFTSHWKPLISICRNRLKVEIKEKEPYQKWLSDKRKNK
jgi:hypothetical protein